MKVTKKDLILLIVLLYILIGVLGGMFLIKPQVENRNEYKAEYQQVSDEKFQKDNNIAQIPAVEKTIEELNAEIDSLKANFYEYRENPEVHIQTLIQAEIGSLTKLNDLVIVSPDIPVVSKTVSEVDPNANPDIDIPDEGVIINNDPAQPVQILSTDVTIKVEGSIDNLISFADQIQQLKNVIEFNSVYVESKDAEDTSNVVYTGTFVLSFVSVF